MNVKLEEMKKSLILIAFGVTLFWGLNHIDFLSSIFSQLLSISSPFLLGIAIAFIFNAPMASIENVLYNEKSPLRKMNDRMKRAISYTLTLLSFLLVLFILLFLVIPELREAFTRLSEKIPDFLTSLYQFFDNVFDENPFILEQLEGIEWDAMSENIISFLKDNTTNWLGSTYDVASTAVGSIVNFSLAFIFSVYVLLFKEKLIKITKKFIIAHFPKKFSTKLLDVGQLTNEAFSGFLKGKLREVFVIIALFSVTMKLLNFPYALTISVLIGTLTLIPWFGVFIGFTIGFLLILAIDVKMAFWFLILFLILYQVEGNLIYPIVVGKASGLSSIWIFVAGTLGAQMGGIVGLVLSIPIFSVIYSLIAQSTNRRLDQKNIDSVDEW